MSGTIDVLKFRGGEWVVYPTNGVGKVAGIEEAEIAGCRLELIVIHFDKDRMTLRIPVAKARNSGLRPLSSRDQMKSALLRKSQRATFVRFSTPLLEDESPEVGTAELSAFIRAIGPHIVSTLNGEA